MLWQERCLCFDIWCFHVMYHVFMTEFISGLLCVYFRYAQLTTIEHQDTPIFRTDCLVCVFFQRRLSLRGLAETKTFSSTIKYHIGNLFGLVSGVLGRLQMALCVLFVAKILWPGGLIDFYKSNTSCPRTSLDDGQLVRETVLQYQGKYFLI